MSQSTLHKLKIINRAPGRVQTGASTEIYLDDKKLTSTTFVKFEVKAKGVAKVVIEMFADVEIESELPLELKPSERIEKNLEPIMVNGEVTGYTSPRYVIGRYSPAKIDIIEKEKV